MTARTLISLCVWVLLASSCRIDPPLHLRRPAEVGVVLETAVNVDVMWQVNWETLWEYAWDVRTLGPLGYEEPQSMRLHSYGLDEQDKPITHQSYNFLGRTGRLQVYAGFYNFLFFNNDSESILFSAASEFSDIEAYTRVISKGLQMSDIVRTLRQKSETKADSGFDPSDDEVVLAPDGLFSLFERQVWISDNIEDYDYIDGHYVFRVKGSLHPASFIYLIQITLVNNNGRVVGSAGGAAITGMTGRTNLNTGETSDVTVSVPFEVHINRQANPDMLGARVVTLGIPGCNPYDAESVAAAPEVPHYLVLSVAYSNGSYRNIRVDITEQVRALPTGGVIPLTLDVDDFPPDPEPGPGGGGFNALVKGWEEETGGYTIRQ